MKNRQSGAYALTRGAVWRAAARGGRSSGRFSLEGAETFPAQDRAAPTPIHANTGSPAALGLMGQRGEGRPLARQSCAGDALSETEVRGSERAWKNRRSRAYALTRGGVWRAAAGAFEVRAGARTGVFRWQAQRICATHKIVC